MSDDPAIYLDFQATTPVDPDVLATMLPYFSDVFGNPHADSHGYGTRAAAAIAAARVEVATLIGAEPREIIFTSGATESNNLLLRGAAQLAADMGRPRIVTCATEHKAVLEVVAALAREGAAVTILDVEPDGLLDIDRFLETLADDVGLVSVMMVNNEIGVIQPIADLAHACRQRGILFHTDATQAVGKIAIDTKAMEIDFLSLSAHKLYGPKGVGAAFVRRELRRVFPAFISGGGQEGGLRGGTLPTPLCVGLGAACRIAGTRMDIEQDRLTQLRDRLLRALDGAGVAYQINGSLDRRWPGNLNLSFTGVDAEALIMSVGDRLAIASGSACTTTSLAPSHVLLALGMSEERAEEAVRIGMGSSTSPDEVDRAAAILIETVRRLGTVRFLGAQRGL